MNALIRRATIVIPATLLLIICIGYLLFISLSASIGISEDGLLLTFLNHVGSLQAFQWDNAKSPGRFFVGVAWIVADFLGAKDIGSLNRFMFCCIVVNAALCFALVYLLAPNRIGIAVVAASLKLTASANFEIFSNANLSVYFAESFYWIATILLVCVATDRLRGRQQQLLSGGAIAACISIVTGSYQTAWPLLCATPILFLPVMLRTGTPLKWLGVIASWYSAFLLIAIPSYLVSRTQLGKKVNTGEWFSHYVTGLKASTYDFWVQPLLAFRSNLSLAFQQDLFFRSTLLVALLILLSVLVFVTGDSLRNGTSRKTALLLIAVGAATAMMSALPPSFKLDVAYGTRHVHFASMGAIVMTVGAILLLSSCGRISHTLSLAAVCSFLVAAAFHLLIKGEENARYGRRVNAFWSSLVQTVPAAVDGSVILVETGNEGDSPSYLRDGNTTFAARAFLANKSLWCVVGPQSRFRMEEGTKPWRVDAGVNFTGYKKTNRWWHVDGYFPPRRPLKEAEIDPIRVIYLRFDGVTHHLDLTKSQTTNIIVRPPSDFARTLFKAAVQ